MYNPPGRKLYDTPLMRQLLDLRPTLGPALTKVANFILRFPLRSATLNIEELGIGTRTSTAAVNRLATSMGLQGFTGLHAALVENLMGWISPVDKVRYELAAMPDSTFTLEQQVRLSKGNLDGVIDSNTQGVFEAMVDALAAAQHIYVLGFGNSHHLAGLFCDWLIPYCRTLTAINMDGGIDHSAHRIAALRPADTLITIALPEYSRESMHMARYARTVGATVLAITDSPVSPLVAIAHLTLFAPRSHPILANSKGAVLAVIEALVSALHQRQLPQVNEAMQLAQTALAHMYGEVPLDDLQYGKAVAPDNALPLPKRGV